ncbi:MAG: hypothetical protein K0U78_00905 [Actinomycetia bacterium]|nr:hypothetical protein [Actinomycetes bacterium]
MRLLALALLAIQVICALLLGAVTAFLLRKTVIGDAVPTPRTLLAQVFISGLQRDELVDVYVVQDTAIGQELSLAFSFFSDERDGRESEPLSVEVTFSADEAMDIQCLKNDNWHHDLGEVDREQLSPETRRGIEVLQWDGQTDFPTAVDNPGYLREREAFWSRVHAYHFTTKTAPLPRVADDDHPGASRRTIVKERNRKMESDTLGYPEGFYCTVSPQSTWRRSSAGDYTAFTPAQVASVPQGLKIGSLYNPTKLHANTEIERDLNFIATQKPDATTVNLGRWQFRPAVIEHDTGSVAPSDYFVFEQADRANRQSQYSFALGIAVTLLVALLTAIVANVFRAATGRSEYYHLADD